MKKCLMVCFAVLLISSAAHAQLPPVGYAGLYNDAGRTTWCDYNPGVFHVMQMYLWCLPNDLGQMCVEFSIDYPGDPGVILSTVTYSPHVSVNLGDIDTGLSVCFLECQWDWHYPLFQTILVNTSAQSTIRIVAHEASGLTAFANCEDGFPMEDFIVYTHLYINYEPGVDAECSETASGTASWGVIKQMFAE